MRLTDRQREVLGLFVGKEALSHKEIANRLQIDIKTVGYHLGAIQRKAGIYGQHTVKLVRWAIENGYTTL